MSPPKMMVGGPSDERMSWGLHLYEDDPNAAKRHELNEGSSAFNDDDVSSDEGMDRRGEDAVDWKY